MDNGRGRETAIRVFGDNAGTRCIKPQRSQRGRVFTVILGGRLHMRRPLGQNYRIAAGASRRGLIDERATHLECDAYIGPVDPPLEFASPGFEWVHPRRHGVSIAAGRGGGELCAPDIVGRRFHFHLAGLAVPEEMPSQHCAQPVVAIGETMRFYSHGFAGDSLHGKPPTIDHR